MSNSDKKIFELNLKPQKQNDWLNISVFDADDELISRQVGSFSHELPKGLYTVVSELSGSTTQTIIKHTTNNFIDVEVPNIIGFNQTIDFNKIASGQSYEDKITFNNENLNTSKRDAARLFIFCHGINAEYKDEINGLFKHLRIFDERNKLVLEMERSHWEINKEEGWMSFQTHLDPGMYFFNYKKLGKNRSFSIALYPKYQTQIILPLGKKPDFNSVQIGISKEHFTSNEGNITFNDFKTAENKLLNSDYELPASIIESLAYGKWSNPLYGIIVVYIYLLSGKRTHEKLIKIVLNNLENKIVNSDKNPDLNVLNLLFELHLAKINGVQLPNVNTTITNVPMFRVGVDKLIELSYLYPTIIEEGGMIDLISGRLRYDSIWTCFKPTKMKYNFEVKRDGSRLNSRSFSNKPMGMNSSSKKRLFGKLQNTIKNIGNISDLLEDFLPAIIELSNSKSNAYDTPEKLAPALGVPLVTLKRKVNELNGLMQNNEKVIRFTTDYLETFFKREFDEDELLDYIQNLSNQLNKKELGGYDEPMEMT